MSETKSRPTTVRLQNIIQGFGRSAALMSAVELGVFTVIAGGAVTIEAVARSVDIHPVNAERLLVMLTAMELVHVDDGGKFSNADDVARFLVAGQASYAGPWMLFNKPQWNDWGLLTDHLRVKDLRIMGPIDDFSVDDARAYHQATYSIGMGAGRRFVKQVDLSGRKMILDLGGGSGAYCINAAKAHPEIRAVVFDLPPVAQVATEFIAEDGVSDRVTAVGGNFTSDDFPAGADVVIMASNLPMYGPDMIAHVVAKAFQALQPGGEMHLIGETLDDDRAGPIGPAYWGLGQAISETMGVAHSEADCVGYFEKAGFADIAAIPFIPGTLTRIYGRKAD